MNFYQKHIGDFNNATRHLTRVERSLYSDAIELYYDTEKPLVKDFDRLCRLLLAHTNDEKAALKNVLDEFFILTDDGYFNKRCDEEIVKYQGFKESRSKAGKASAEQRANKKATDVEHVLNTRATNHKPITNKTKGSRLSKDFPLTEEFIDAALEITPSLTGPQIKYTFDGFVDYWIGQAGSKGVKLDWLATWRNWIRRQSGPPAATKERKLSL